MLLKVQDLSVVYRGKDHRAIQAVDHVSLELAQGECVGIVGESGCGKSSFARAVAGLEPKSVGRIFLNGEDISDGTQMKKRQYRQQIQMIFQDSSTAQNHQMKMRQYLAEPLRNFRIVPNDKVLEESIRLLNEVRLPAEYLFKYPQNMSGGERQRCAIARAIACRPSVLICDEPTSALDVSTQAEIIKLLLRLKGQLMMSYLFISHDLALVRQICTRIAIMFCGVIVEVLDVKEIQRCFHPYTKRLFDASFTLEKSRDKEDAAMEDDMDDIDVSQLTVGSGCVYASICDQCVEQCRSARPGLTSVGHGVHQVACWRIKEATGE